jgi:hypothetical protein
MLMGRGLDGQSSVPGKARFYISHGVQTDPGAHPASCPVGTLAYPLALKWLGCEADHSPQSHATVTSG